MMNYADYQHPVVNATAQRLAEGNPTPAQQVRAIFYYVRDEIKFGFLPEVDRVAASTIIQRGMGQCNNKSVLFLALCRALDIPARIHFSPIHKSIQRGLVPGWAYRFMPEDISHSWMEVELDGHWHTIDAYVNDADYYAAARQELLRKGWENGFSVADAANASIDFSLNNDSFVQMSAVTGDHGVFDNPADYFASDDYLNQVNPIKRLLARVAFVTMNRRVAALRQRQHTVSTAQPA